VYRTAAVGQNAGGKGGYSPLASLTGPAGVGRDLAVASRAYAAALDDLARQAGLAA